MFLSRASRLTRHLCHRSRTESRSHEGLRMRALLTIALAAVLAACTRQKEVRQPNDTARKAVVAAPPAEHARAVRSPTDSLAYLLQGLAVQKGEFAVGAPGDRWAYSGDVGYLDAVAAFQDQAVARLVDCLADMRPAAATANGHPVPIGAMCYEALTHMAYYEAYEDQPDGPNKYGSWEGDVTPVASGPERERAQRAWKRVLKERRVSLL